MRGKSLKRKLHKAMEKRWTDLTEDLIDPGLGQKWWKTITETLENSQVRKYFYNMDYLQRRFQLFDEFRDKLSNPKAAAIAMIFQHLHYDFQTHGIDEEATLDLFQSFVADCHNFDSQLKVDIETLLHVAAVNSTEVHLKAEEFGTSDEHYFLDFDTAIMGSSPIDYNDYAARLRDEYRFLNDKEYAQLRLKVLKNFLLIPNIFATESFRTKHETAARQNIGNEIKSLESLLKN